MALADLNRSNDTPIATNFLSTIVSKEWPTLPLRVPSTTPEYLGDVTYNWPYNGLVGNDVNVATANATGYYEPKNQGNKANMLGDANRLAVDITTPSGWIDPKEPYGPAPVPTLTGLVPDSRVVAPTDDLSLVIIGTNFMPSSEIWFANHFERVTYVSPVQLQTLLRGTVFTGPGVVTVAVINDGIPSNTQNFTFTPAP
jgi:hypothetical protein